VDGPADHHTADAGASDHHRHRDADGIRGHLPRADRIAGGGDGGALRLDGGHVDGNALTGELVEDCGPFDGTKRCENYQP